MKKSERNPHRRPYAALLDVRTVAVVETPHVVDAQELEDVLDAYAGLHVGLTAEGTAPGGEGTEPGTNVGEQTGGAPLALGIAGIAVGSVGLIVALAAVVLKRK